MVPTLIGGGNYDDRIVHTKIYRQPKIQDISDDKL
jgi:hypothetical protein